MQVRQLLMYSLDYIKMQITQIEQCGFGNNF